MDLKNPYSQDRESAPVSDSGLANPYLKGKPAPKPKADGPSESDFVRGLARGTDSLQSSTGGALEVAGELTGIDRLTNYGRGVRERNQAEAAENASDVGGFTDIRSAGDTVDYVQGTAGEVIPQMAPSLAGGAAGAALGSLVGPVGTVVGGVAGALVPSVFLGTGEAQSKIKERGGTNPLGALATGAVSGSLDSVLGGRLGGQLVRKIGGEAAETAAKKSIGRELGENALLEGTTEALQGQVTEFGAAKSTGTEYTFDPKQAINEFAAGTIGGGIATGALKAASITANRPDAPAATETATETAPDAEAPLLLEQLPQYVDSDGNPVATPTQSPLPGSRSITEVNQAQPAEAQPAAPTIGEPSAEARPTQPATETSTVPPAEAQPAQEAQPPAPAPEAPPVESQPAPEAETIRKSNGEPFASAATAVRAIANRRLSDVEVIPVEGGFALRRLDPDQPAAQEATQQQTEASEQVVENLGELGATGEADATQADQVDQSTQVDPEVVQSSDPATISEPEAPQASDTRTELLEDVPAAETPAPRKGWASQPAEQTATEQASEAQVAQEAAPDVTALERNVARYEELARDETDPAARETINGLLEQSRTRLNQAAAVDQPESNTSAAQIQNDAAQGSTETVTDIDQSVEGSPSQDRSDVQSDTDTTVEADAALSRTAATVSDTVPQAAAEIDRAANEAATSPTNDLVEPSIAQQEAGNYKKGAVKAAGLDIAIENPKGSQRKGVDRDGKEWSTTMKSHYGYVKGSEAIDGDAVDVFLTDGASDPDKPVFVVDQVDPATGKYDEPKVVLGVDTEQQARSAYLANYDKGWKGDGAVTKLTQAEFKQWVKSPESKKPLGFIGGSLNVEQDTGPGIKRAVIERVTKQSMRRMPNASDVAIVNTPDQIPNAGLSKSDKKVDAVYVDGKTYLVRSNIASEEQLESAIIHENQHHGMVGKFDNKVDAKLDTLYKQIEDDGGLDAVIKRMNIPYSKSDYDKYFDQEKYTAQERSRAHVDELLAHIATMPEEQTGKLGQAVKQVVELIRRSLQAMGLKKTAAMSDKELLNTVSEVQNWLREGADTAPTQRDRPRLHKAYHGSSSKFDSFSSDKIGTGEGGSAFGAGLYFADHKKVADHYRNVKSKNKKSGVTYEVDLSPKNSDYLLWNESVTDQSSEVLSVIKDQDIERLNRNPSKTGEYLYKGLVSEISGLSPDRRIVDRLLSIGAITSEADIYSKNTSKLASDFLKSYGIRGIKYSDDSTAVLGKKGEPSTPGYGYVIFDESDVKIKARLSQNGPTGDGRISTRKPWAKSASGQELSENLVTSAYAYGESGKKAFDKNVSLLTGYSNYRESKSANTPEKQAERFIALAKENLLWLHDQVPAEISKRSRKWYDGSRAITDRMSKRYDISDRSVAGIFAALSPQKDWYQNVSLGERVMDIMSTQKETAWTPDMQAVADDIYGKGVYAEQLARVSKSKLGELTDPMDQAMWLRTFDQTYNTRSYRIVSSEGDFQGYAKTAKGNEAKVAWGSNNEIAKAISVYNDPSIENINSQMGAQHKVRNFYNNIVAPKSEHGDVTIDTHAVAAALLKPLSGKSIEVTQNFGGAGSASNASAGMSGTYPFYAEAYRQAAAARGILPREMQSITWEAVRGLFSASYKGQASNVEAITSIWDRFNKGRISLDKARAEVEQHAGGITDPSWFGSDTKNDASAVDSSYKTELSRPRLPRGSPDPVDSGAGGVATRGAAERSANVDGSGGGSYKGREGSHLEGLPDTVKVDGVERRFTGLKLAQDTAEAYMAKAGLEHRPVTTYAPVNTERAKRIAAAFDAMEHNPQDPAVKASYRAMIDETYAQYQSMLDSGLNVEFNNGSDPYGNPRNAILDVVENNHLYIFATKDGFGSNAEFDPSDNPLLEVSPFRFGDQEALANDVFRAVHDYFGHIRNGVGFRARGEENAWRSHATMYSDLARPAATTETRGQNSWLNYGPHADTNQTALVEDTIFADQKIGLLPDWAMEDQEIDSARQAAQPTTTGGNRVEAIHQLRKRFGERSYRGAIDEVGGPFQRGSDPATTRHGLKGRSITPDKATVEALASINETTPEFVQLDQTPENDRRFRTLALKAQKANKFGASMDVFSIEEYKGMELFVAKDGKSGFAVSPDGYLKSVFSMPGGDRTGVAMTTLAIQSGAVNLDAFDTVLPEIYSVAGFKEVSRAQWDDQYKPKGWDKELFAPFNNGEPDLVSMQFDPDSFELYSKDARKPRFSMGPTQVRLQGRAKINEAKEAVQRYVKRNFTKEGLTNAATFKAKIDSDSYKRYGENEIAHLIFDFEQQVKDSYGVKRYNSLSKEQLASISDYLGGDRQALIPMQLKPAVDDLRAHLDKQSGEMLIALADLVDVQVRDLSPEDRQNYDLYTQSGGQAGRVPAKIFKSLNMLNTITNNVGSYLNRSYEAFDNADWKDKAMANEDLMTRVDDHLAQRHPTWSASRRTGEIRAILEDAREKGGFTSMLGAGGSKEGSKDVSFLKARKDIPPVIRELLGEYRDPKVLFARSVTKMSWHVANHNFLMRLRAEGEGVFLFKEPRDGFDAKIAGDDSETMSPLDGMYSTADYKLGLMDMKEKFEGSDLMRNLIRVNSMIKYGKTILSPTTQARNFQSAAMFTIMNGHFNWKHMSKSFAVAKGDLMQGNDVRWRGYLNELTGLGVLHDNPYASELKLALQDFMEIDTYSQGAMQGPKKVADFMQRAYAAGDDFWKIIGFENEKARMMKRGMSESEAQAKAAERIRDGYPTYSMVPRGVRKIRIWPLIGTFVSFPYEAIRTTYNQTKFMREDAEAGDWESVTARAAGFAMASSAAWAVSAYTMSMMGISDEDDEAIRALLPEWSQNSQLAYTGYNDQGQPEYLDLSYLDPYTYLKKPITALMNGNYRDFEQRSLAALTELAMPFIGGDIGASAVGEIIFNKKMGGGTVFNPNAEAWDKATDIVKHVKKAVQPGFVSNIERTIQAIEGDVSRSGRQYTIGNEAVAFLGHRVTTLNVPQAILYRSYGFTDGVRNSSSILSRAVATQSKMSDGEVTEAFDAMILSRKKVYGDMIKLVESAKKLGFDRQEINKAMTYAKVSDRDRASIWKGEMPKWKMSRTFNESALKRAMLAAPTEERRREVRAMLQQRQQLIARLARAQ